MALVSDFTALMNTSFAAASVVAVLILFGLSMPRTRRFALVVLTLALLTGAFGYWVVGGQYTAPATGAWFFAAGGAGGALLAIVDLVVWGALVGSFHHDGG
jgi:hypothetical protein